MPQHVFPSLSPRERRELSYAIWAAEQHVSAAIFEAVFLGQDAAARYEHCDLVHGGLLPASELERSPLWLALRSIHRQLGA